MQSPAKHAVQDPLSNWLKLEANGYSTDDSFDGLEISGKNEISQASPQKKHNVSTESVATIHKQESQKSDSKSSCVDVEVNDLVCTPVHTPATQRSLQSSVFRTPRVVRAPDGFLQSSVNLPLHRKNTEKELWLVQVPAGFDVHCLNNALQKTSLNTDGMKKLKVKTEDQAKSYNVHIYRDFTSGRDLATLGENSKGATAIGDSVRNSIIVTEKLEMPHNSNCDIKSIAAWQVPVPSGLRVRFTSFGADKPKGQQPTIFSPKTRKRKKSGNLNFVYPKEKKLKLEVIESCEETVPFPGISAIHEPCLHTKSSNDRNNLLNAAENYVSGTYPQHFQVGLSEEFMSPRKHKRSKNRRAECEGMPADVEGNGHLLMRDYDDAESPSKHKKSKRHRLSSEASQSQDLFVMDRIGEDGMSEELMSFKHKKSKRHRLSSEASLSQDLFVMDRKGEDGMSEELMMSFKHKKSKKKKERRAVNDV